MREKNKRQNIIRGTTNIQDHCKKYMNTYYSRNNLKYVQTYKIYT